ncbi:MAG: hypothetical protein GY711_23270 [bacterium]|nr:hypothetical protein [bacterium]
MGDLPEFVPPMLARLGRRPFDSGEHLFEIKWDGTRVVAFIESSGYRLRNRQERDVFATYPDLAALADLPAGTVLDGEVCVLEDGKPSFNGMLRREQARGERNVATIARLLPATYIVFDLLYLGGESLLDVSLAERRSALEGLMADAPPARVAFSDGLVGAGNALFEQVRSEGLEGMVAKRLDSVYLPGQRTDDWTKVKTFQQVLCAILGYAEDETRDLKSLIVATDDGGGLRCVGRVGSGLTDAQRRDLKARIDADPRRTPLVPCDFDGHWVEPGLYCNVSFLEFTSEGMLRAPVFKGLVAE